MLLEKSNLTPRPELLCIMVLYSSSSLSLRSYTEAVGEVGRAGDMGGVGWGCVALEPIVSWPRNSFKAVEAGCSYSGEICRS